MDHGSSIARSASGRLLSAGIRVRVLSIVVVVLVGVLAIVREPGARNFGVIEEGTLYRSGRMGVAALRRVIEERHIRTIVDLGAYEPGSAEESLESSVAEGLGVRRVVLRLRGDGTGDPNMYVDALRVMTDRNAQPVLIHCAAGTNRTGACAMLYRHIIEGIGFGDAYREAMTYGHDPGSDWVTLTYLAEWSDEIEESLESGDTIPFRVAARSGR